MRRLLPHLAALLAALLLVQWSQGAAACLAMLRLEPASVICHAGAATAPDGPQDDSSQHAGLACPHCAPLPPALAAVPPVVTPSRAAALLAAEPLPPVLAALPTRPNAHQPRGPPLQA